MITRWATIDCDDCGEPFRVPLDQMTGAPITTLCEDCRKPNAKAYQVRDAEDADEFADEREAAAKA